MPRGDGTGPMGAGPMTGRGLGFCAGYGALGFMNPMPGRGLGMGFGGGRGFGGGGGGGGRGRRNMFYATGLPGWMRFNQGFFTPQAAPTAEAQKNFLKEQAASIQAQLDQINARLEALNTAEPETK